MLSSGKLATVIGEMKIANLNVLGLEDGRREESVIVMQ